MNDKKYIITEYQDMAVQRNLHRGQGEAICVGDFRMQVSDGYHTMDELYEHRMILFIAFCRNYQKYIEPTVFPTKEGQLDNVWRSKKHSDDSDYPGWFILGIKKRKGEQITYHIPDRLWNQTEFAQTLEKAPEWDGHTPDDVLKRIALL